MASFAPPLSHLEGLVRNASEAGCLVRLDCESVRHEVLHDQLLACCAQEHQLQRLRQALLLNTLPAAKEGGSCNQSGSATTVDSGSPEVQQLRSARVLCEEALACTRRNIDMLVTEADSLLQNVDRSATELRRYAENNEAFLREIEEAGASSSLAAAKQRLWLVEESLTARVEATLSALRAKLNPGPPAPPNATQHAPPRAPHARGPTPAAPQRAW